MTNEPRTARFLAALLAALALAAGCAPGGDSRPRVSLATHPKESAATGSPRWIAERFLAPHAGAELKRWYAGEVAERYAGGRTLGDELASTMRRTFHEIPLDDTSCAIAVDVRGAKRQGLDCYLYFSREGREWRLAAMRMLTVQSDPGPASDVPWQERTRRAEVDALGENLRLRTATDDSLCRYASEYRGELDALVAMSSRRWFPGRVSVDEPMPDAAPAGEGRVRLALQRLHLRTLGRSPDWPGLVFVSAGGSLNSDVGFLWTEPGASPPRMSPTGWILVRPLEGGWYLYKTG